MAKTTQTKTATKPANIVQVKKAATKLKTKSKSTKKPKPKLTHHDKEKRAYQKEITNVLQNIGFTTAPSVDNKHFIYDDRKTELDDIFFFENIILLTEYTIGDPGTHLKEKKIIYDKINKSPVEFLKFLYGEKQFKTLKSTLDKKILNKYSYAQVQLRILYCSKKQISKDHKILVDQVKYFDYPIVKYFASIAKTIKRSSKHEFFDFLNIDFTNVGENVFLSSKVSTDEFSGHILPEEHSSFDEGYKIISFYIDAASLIRRAFVLRRDGWQNKDNIGFYQRMLQPAKIKSMRKYLHEQGRVFINNIIVTLPIDQIKVYDEKGALLKIESDGSFIGVGTTKVMPTQITIENKTNIIGVIDGQHRTYAYYEGDDVYEKTIAKLRGIQNLLVTGILYPKDEDETKRLKFEAQLFLEINSNQQSAATTLKQDIEFMLQPFSGTSISKFILVKLNEAGPLDSMLEQYWYEKTKIKTSTIISYGLKPLVKLDGKDSLFAIWPNTKKATLKKGDNYVLLKDYRDFCVREVRNIFVGLKANVDKSDWKMDRTSSTAMLNVTTINGVINCLRLLIENGKTGDVEYYINKFAKIKGFDFKKYKSSQYRQMGEDIYKRCFV